MVFRLVPDRNVGHVAGRWAGAGGSYSVEVGYHESTNTRLLLFRLLGFSPMCYN